MKSPKPKVAQGKPDGKEIATHEAAPKGKRTRSFGNLYTEDQLAETREKMNQRGTKEAKFNSKRGIEEALLGKKYTDNEWTAIVRDHFELNESIVKGMVRAGFEYRGRVSSGAGFFGAMQTLAEVRAIDEESARENAQGKESKPKPSK